MTTVPAILFALGVSLIMVTIAACETTSFSLTPSESVTTLMVGWERHFRLGWTVEPEQEATRRIRGYIYSQHGESAVTVRLLAQALDPSGAVVGLRIEWLPGGVGGFGRAYFEVPHLPFAANYRVTVWDYTFFQSEGDRT